MTPLTEKLKEIRARLEAATPGPWVVSEYGGSVETTHPDYQKVSHSYAVYHNSICNVDDGEYVVNSNLAGDAAFIAAAPSDIAFLLATVERMTAALQFYATTSEVNDITLRFGWRARAALGEKE